MKSKLYGLAAMSALLAMAQTSSNTYCTQYVPKDDSKRKKTHPQAKQGQQQFTYSDGFTCISLNKKNADRKHLKWLKARKEANNGN